MEYSHIKAAIVFESEDIKSRTGTIIFNFKNEVITRINLFYQRNEKENILSILIPDKNFF